MMAKPRTNGVLGTSRARMLKSQQIDSGRVRTAASALSSPSALRRSASLSCGVLPARLWPRNSIGLRGGAVGPNAVDEIVGCDERRAAVELAFEVADFARGVEPWVVADPAARLDVVGDLAGEAGLGHEVHRDVLRVGLSRGLDDVAAVD